MKTLLSFVKGSFVFKTLYLVILMLVCAYNSPVIGKDNTNVAINGDAEVPHIRQQKVHEDCTESQLMEKLTKAFSLAFKETKEFRKTRLFQELGYDLAETNLIANITPRPKKLNVNAKPNVDVSQDDMLAFDELVVPCHRVSYYNMVIERVDFSFVGAGISKKALEKGELKFIKIQEIRLAIMVSETDILAAFNLFIQAQALKKLKLRFEEDFCSIRGTVGMGFLPVSFKVMGIVEMINPKQMNFLCERLELNGQIQPRNFVNALFSKINPVFDSSNIWLNLEITDLKLVKGFVTSKAVIRKK